MKKARIIVVEDESIIAINIQEILESLGYDVQAVVSSGEEAIEKSEEMKPDLVLMDIILSGDMDGIIAADQIQKRLNIPVIYLTAYSEESTLQRAIKTSPYGYLVKPVRKTDLNTAVKTVLHRHELETRLRESEERFQLLFNKAPLGYQALDDDGYIIDVNETWLDMLGYSREEVINRSFRDFLSPTSMDSFNKKFLILKSKGEIHGIECEMIHKDGFYITALFDGKVGYDKKGNLKQAHCMMKDITQQKQAELALGESEERYRDLVENIQDIIYSLDDEGTINYISPVVEATFGYRPSEIIGRSFIELIHVDDRKHFVEALRMSPHDKFERDRIEFRINSRAGEVRWCRASERSVYVGNDIIGTRGIITDITEQKKVEEQLQEANNIINRSPAVAFLWKNEEGWPVEFVSENAQELFGYTAEEFISGSVGYSMIIHPEDLDRVKESVMAYSNEKGLEDFVQEHYRIVARGGEIKWIDERTHIRRDDDNRITHYQGIVIDITDRKRAEEKIRESELRYRELFENMSSGVAVYESVDNGEDFVFLDFNKAGERIEDTRKDGIIGKSVLQVFPGVMDLGLFEVFQRVYRTGNAERHPASLYRDEHIMGWRDNYVYKLPTGEIVAIYDDVTEKMQMEYERNRVYLELDQIFNTTSVGMCLIDREFTITKANKTFLTMFDLEMEDIIGNKCYSIWKEHRCNLDSCPLTRVFGSHTPYKFEVKRERDGKDDIICMVSAVSYLSNDGEIVGVLESFTDITEVRELEKEIISISQKERRSIGQDLHDDFGQKLSYIGFLAEVVRRKMAEHSYDVADIDEIINLVGDSIDNIRSVSKGLHPVEMNPHGFVAAIEELAESTERLLGVHCELDKGGDLHIDDNTIATNLYYIVQESINNAIKHGKAKNIKIQVMSADNRLNLRIEDDGSGVQPEGVIGKGMGLRIMKYRADLIGAEFEARGSEKGFSVWVGLKGGM